MLHSPETEHSSLYGSYQRHASYRSPPSGTSPFSFEDTYVQLFASYFFIYLLLYLIICLTGLKTPILKPSGEETYYSSFHDTPERKKFSKEEWDSFTKVHTDRGIKELVSSPEFNKWALENADRISVTPRDKNSSQKLKQQSWFFSWF
jgi:hypothetical protein